MGQAESEREGVRVVSTRSWKAGTRKEQLLMAEMSSLAGELVDVNAELGGKGCVIEEPRRGWVVSVGRKGE